jgi:hypothetical protein
MDFIFIVRVTFVEKDVKEHAITGTKEKRRSMEVLLNTKVLVTRVIWETFPHPTSIDSIF